MHFFRTSRQPWSNITLRSYIAWQSCEWMEKWFDYSSSWSANQEAKVVEVKILVQQRLLLLCIERVNWAEEKKMKECNFTWWKTSLYSGYDSIYNTRDDVCGRKRAVDFFCHFNKKYTPDLWYRFLSLIEHTFLGVQHCWRSADIVRSCSSTIGWRWTSFFPLI